MRPQVVDDEDGKAADAKPTEAEEIESEEQVLKPWIMPTGNDFVKDPAKKYSRPEDEPAVDFPFIQRDFDDSSWEQVILPHDWAIEGPFFEGWNTEIGGGREAAQSWYRLVSEKYCYS